MFFPWGYSRTTDSRGDASRTELSLTALPKINRPYMYGSASGLPIMCHGSRWLPQHQFHSISIAVRLENARKLGYVSHSVCISRINHTRSWCTSLLIYSCIWHETFLLISLHRCSEEITVCSRLLAAILVCFRISVILFPFFYFLKKKKKWVRLAPFLP